jgi:hypothetical protein
VLSLVLAFWLGFLIDLGSWAFIERGVVIWWVAFVGCWVRSNRSCHSYGILLMIYAAQDWWANLVVWGSNYTPKYIVFFILAISLLSSLFPLCSTVYSVKNKE